jgi:hypothetical protein
MRTGGLLGIEIRHTPRQLPRHQRLPREALLSELCKAESEYREARQVETRELTATQERQQSQGYRRQLVFFLRSRALPCFVHAGNDAI